MLPALLQIGPFALRTYTLLIAAGLAFALYALWQRAPEGRRLVWWDAGLWGIVGGLLGARLLYAIVNNAYYFSHPFEILSVWEGGLAWPGAALGAWVGLWAYTRRQAEPLAPVVEALALPIVVLGALSWGGCLAAGCAYGFEVMPGRWPMWFTLSTPDLYGVIAPRFPTQALGVVWSLLTIALIWYIPRRWQTGALALALVALGALGLSLTRGDPIPLFNQVRLDVIGSGLVLLPALLALLRRPQLRGGPTPPAPLPAGKGGEAVNP